jgi:predicted transcriptional regulator YheO
MASEQEFQKIKPFMASLAKGLSEHFGTNCEVLVHDTTHGPEHTVAIIENGHVTGRKVGDDASETVLEALHDKSIKDRYGYIINSKSGKILKSSTFNFHNDDGEVIAIVCLNFDISDLVMANRSIDRFISAQSTENDAETITDSVENLLNQLIKESHQLIGKPVASMDKDDKTAALNYLDSKGAFLIKKSSERIAEYYCISKYTLYNYLGSGGKEE